MSDRVVTGKGMAVLGLALAAALIVWAVVDPGPAPPDRQRLSDLPTASSSLALRSAVGAVLGVQREAMLRLPQLDEEAIQALLDEYVSELGLELDPQEVQSLLARYRAIAAQAESLIASAPSPQSLSVEDLLRSLIPSSVATAEESTQARQLADLLASLEKAGAAGRKVGGSPGDSKAVEPFPPPAATGTQTRPGTGAPDWGIDFKGEFWQGGSQSDSFDLNGGSGTFDSGMDRLERDLSDMDQ